MIAPVNFDSFWADIIDPAPDPWADIRDRE